MYKHLVIIFSLVALIGCAGGGTDTKVKDPDLDKDCTILGNCDDNPDTSDIDTDDDTDTDAGGGGSGTVRAVKITRGTRDGATEDFVLYEASDLKFRASYGSGSYVWEITNLPEGFTATDLTEKNAKIEGTARNFDEKTVSVKVCDAEDATNCDARSFKIVVKDNISAVARFARSEGLIVFGGGLITRSDMVSETVKIYPPDPAAPCSYLRIVVKGHIGDYTLETSDPDVVKFAELPADVGECESRVRKHLPPLAGSSSSTMPIISKTFYLYVDPTAYGTTRRNVTVTVKDSAGNEDKIKFSAIVFESDPCSTPPVITQVFDPDHPMLNEDGGAEANPREPYHLNAFKFQASGGKGPYIWSVNGKKIDDVLPEDFDYQMSVEAGDTFVVSTSFENLGQILCYTYGSDRPTTLGYPSEKPCTGGRLYSRSMAIDVQDSCPMAQHASKSYSFPLRPSASQVLSGSKINMDVSFGETCWGSCPYNDWGGYLYAQVRFFNKDNKVIAQFKRDPVDGGRHSWTFNPGATAGFGDIPVTEIVRAEFHGHDTNQDTHALQTTLHSLTIWNGDSYLLWDTVHDPYWETSGDDNWENIFTAANFNEISRATDRYVEWKKCDEIGSDPKLGVLRDAGACDMD